MGSAYWFRDTASDFPAELAALNGCDLSVLRIADRYHWLVRQEGRDMAEGVEGSESVAKLAAETAAHRQPEPG